VLTLATVPDPTPAPGEVRVRIHAIGVNFSDTERRRAVFDPPELPWIPGREAAGVIDVVGEGVDPALVGARVAYYSRRPGGSYAELATVAVDELLHFPDSVPSAHGFTSTSLIRTRTSRWGDAGAVLWPGEADALANQQRRVTPVGTAGGGRRHRGVGARQAVDEHPPEQ
jgi:NADPH2:quinone reductase